MDKVKLPKEVAQAIDKLRFDGWTNGGIFVEMNYPEPEYHIDILKGFSHESDQHFDLILAALVNGYEVEETPEDKVRGIYDLWDQWEGEDGYFSSFTITSIIVDVVNALGYKIKGVND